MILIIMHHFALYAPWPEDLDYWTRVAIDVTAIGGKLGVNVFVLISGYFLYTSSFRFRSLFKTAMQVYFYALVCLIGYCFVVKIPSVNMITRSLFPLFTPLNWFVPPYIAMFLLSPALRLLYKQLASGYREAMLLMGLFVLSVVPTALWQNPFDSSFIWFIFLCLVGFSLRKLELEEKRLPGSDRIVLSLRLIKRHSLAVFLLSIGAVLIYIFVAESGVLAVSLDPLRLSEQWSVPIFGLSLATFFFFLRLGSEHWTNTFINRMSAASFGVYLLHDNPLIREGWILLNGVADATPALCIPVVALFVALSIYCACALVDLLRSSLLEPCIHLFFENRFKSLFSNIDAYIAKMEAEALEGAYKQQG